MGYWWKIDPLDWLAAFLGYDKYIFKCKGCGQEIYSLPELKPICNNCTEKGVRC